MSDIISRTPTTLPPAETPSEASTPSTAVLSASEPRLRLWVPAILIALQWIGILLPMYIVPGTMVQFFGMMIGLVFGVLGGLLWWILVARVSRKERWLGAAAFVAVGAIAYPFFHSSLNLFGVFFVILPVATTTIVLTLLVTFFLSWPVRRAVTLVALALVWGFYTQMRFEGVTGDFVSAIRCRWAPTAEELYLADIAAGKIKTADVLASGSARSLSLQQGDWPGFRGSNRDGKLTGVKIATTWNQSPPALVWRHRVGPGWSSFAVIGNRAFTQEQIGNEEAVVCYDSDTGKAVWMHKDPVRFSEIVGGDGPRATPTFHNGKLYAFGATGILNCLDAATGNKIWSRDVAADNSATAPTWGFASSPLITQGLVIVLAAGPPGRSMAAYDVNTGAPAWYAGNGQMSYCSPQPATLDGVEQVLIATNLGMAAFHPTKGDVLWTHSWDLGDKQRVAQPAVLSESDVLLGTPFGEGARRLRISKDGPKWAAKELWTTRALSPHFNDLVVHQDHAYGFTGSFLTCVSLKDGAKKWRERGYGAGQVLLLADQDLLLVVSEQGAVALVEAKPESFHELGRFQAIEGKTWNHPVVAHGKLFVRNSEEAACYQLTEVGGR